MFPFGWYLKTGFPKASGLSSVGFGRLNLRQAAFAERQGKRQETLEVPSKKPALHKEWLRRAKQIT
jgi:hypothetical protein